jgi:hypothetical protein
VPDEIRRKLPDDVVDELLAGARTEEEIVGPGGLLSQLTKRLVERAFLDALVLKIRDGGSAFSGVLAIARSVSGSTGRGIGWACGFRRPRARRRSYRCQERL